MKYSRFCLFIILILTICLYICPGCSDKTSTPSSTKSTLSIVIKDHIPAAQVGASYDLSSLIQIEEETEYTFIAQYTDPVSGETKQLNVKKNKITPRVEADIAVTVTATQGETAKTIDFTVPIAISADAIDQYLVADEADPGVQKSITKDPAHLQASPSTSAVAITFSNPTDANEGTNLLTLSQYQLQAYYTAQVWRNAAVTCWVYNPGGQEITFKLAAHNSDSNQTYTWKSADNVQEQIALPGQWTKLAFSLYDMNITQPLFQAPDQSKPDYLKLMARSADNAPCTLYIDDVDIVHADTLPELKTSYERAPLPTGNFSDLLRNHKVYTEDPLTKLSTSTKGNSSQNAYCFGADQATGYPSFYIDFPQVTDIRGFDYLKFDTYAQDAYPWISVAIRYLDDDRNIQKQGVSFDFKVDQWRTLYLNLHSLTDADLSKAVGIQFTIHMDSKFVPSRFNCLYFDNVSLYTYPQDEPQMAPALVEDNDILSAPVYVSNADPSTCGVVKVATDETGLEKSNSSVLFWANSACGYPSATFYYETEQDWSDYNVLAFDTHQVNAHYWMHFEILYLDEDGKQRTLSMYNDTVFNHWMTTNAPFEWFQTQDGESAKEEHLAHVVGFRITVDFAHNMTDEMAYIFFDNFQLT